MCPASSRRGQHSWLDAAHPAPAPLQLVIQNPVALSANGREGSAFLQRVRLPSRIVLISLSREKAESCVPFGARFVAVYVARPLALRSPRRPKCSRFLRPGVVCREGRQLLLAVLGLAWACYTPRAHRRLPCTVNAMRVLRRVESRIFRTGLERIPESRSHGEFRTSRPTRKELPRRGLPCRRPGRTCTPWAKTRGGLSAFFHPRTWMEEPTPSSISQRLKSGSRRERKNTSRIEYIPAQRNPRHGTSLTSRISFAIAPSCQFISSN
jgi:hypothetical protein